MSKSRQKEILSALWAICALIAFANGFEIWGDVFTVKAAFDTICAVWLSYYEIRAESTTERGEG